MSVEDSFPPQSSRVPPEVAPETVALRADAAALVPHKLAAFMARDRDSGARGGKLPKSAKMHEISMRN